MSAGNRRLKRAVNGTKKSKKTNRQVPSEGIGKRIIAGVVIALVAIVIGVVAWEGMAPKYLLAVNGEKLKEKDLMYDIYQSELMGSQMASLYAQFGYTEDYWNMTNEDGTNTQDTLREQTIENYLYNRILYAEAVKQGYEATEDEKKQAEESAASDIETLTEKKVKSLGMSKELLTERALEELVVARYKTDTVEGLDIDDEAIKAGVDYETNRGYNVEYFFAATTTTNDDGEQVAVEDKTAVYSELESVMAKAETSDDWSKIIDAEDEDAAVTYTTKVLTADDGTFDETVMGDILKMQNGDVSEIVETDSGYYVFRMVNNNDPEKYDTAVNDAISDAEESAFTEVYQGLKEAYTIKTYDLNWKSIVFGTVTLS